MSIPKILITGAAGQIAYSLIPLLCRSEWTSSGVHLNLFDLDFQSDRLKGLSMELCDSGFKNLKSHTITTDPSIAFKDIDIAILIGGFPRKKGMTRKDLLEVNGPIFKKMGVYLQLYASSNCKVLVVANPANTNCLISSTNAPKIHRKNFSALTRLDHNRTAGFVADYLNLEVSDVKNVCVWGNHSSSQVPDISRTCLNDGYRILYLDDIEEKCAESVRKRGKQILEHRGLSSSMSAAKAINDCLRDLFMGTTDNVSMAVYIEESHYGIKPGLFYSFPVTCRRGEWILDATIEISDNLHRDMKRSEVELLEEFESAKPYLF